MMYIIIAILGFGLGSLLSYLLIDISSPTVGEIRFTKDGSFYSEMKGEKELNYILQKSKKAVKFNIRK